MTTPSDPYAELGKAVHAFVEAVEAELRALYELLLAASRKAVRR